MPGDPIFKIGEAGLNAAEEKIKNLMTKMVNSETPGFKGSDVLVRSFPLELEAAEKRINSMAPRVEGTYYNHHQGTLVKTGNQTDIALGSQGCFVILGEWGEGYTRDGRFKLSEQGRLLSSVGNYPLLGRMGPIEVAPGSLIEITQDGDVKANGTVVDRIRVVQFDKKDLPNLVSLNGSIFRGGSYDLSAEEVETPRIAQGYIESSNVSIMEEMRDMVIVQRYAQGNADIIKARDAGLSRSMTIGRTNNQ